MGTIFPDGEGTGVLFVVLMGTCGVTGEGDGDCPAGTTGGVCGVTGEGDGDCPAGMIRVQ